MIELLPTGSADVLKVAAPAVRATVPSDVVPLKNWIEPVGVPAPGLDGVTTAVMVTGCPTVPGLGVIVSDVVVFAIATL